ncbi:MAG: PAS domain S-box protein [Deltaproteobacteria bacterium]|nr:PAS domain S-box protein [Deltaproteobacteria bacterium]
MDSNIKINLHNLSAEEALNELFHIYRKLTSTNTYKDVLAIFQESLKKRVDQFEASIIVFLDKNKADGSGEVIASSEIRDNKTIVIDLNKYPEIKAAVEKKEAVAIEDIEKTTIASDEIKSVILSKGIRSSFVLPIFDINDIMGVVLIRSKNPIMLSPFLQQYYFIQANMLASAILNISRMKILEESMNKAYELLKIKEDYEFLFNHAMDGMILVDREGRIRNVNRAFEKLTGYSKQEIIGEHYSRAIANEASLETANKIFSGYLKKQFVNKFEVEIKAKNGAYKTLSLRATPLAGRQDVSLISLRDVTEEKLLSKELLKTTDLLLKTISSSSDAIIAVDTTGKLLFFNEESTQLFGYSRDEAIQYIHVTQLYPQNVAKEVMKLLRQSPTKHIRNYPIEVRTRGGEIVPVTLSGAIVYNEKGEEQMSVGYLRDEREKIRMEKSLDEALSKLIEAEKNDAMTNLAGAAAHNLNQPLSAIQGYSELLINRLKDKDQTTVDYASKIIREVEKMTGIIKQISRITKYEIKPYAGTAKIVDLTNKKSND